jgi:hypothetical protein
VSATGSAGSVSVGERLKAITGNQAMGRVGDFAVFYWSLIDDSENANWQNINSAQSSSWALIDDSENASWQNVNNAQSSGWTLIDDEQPPGWVIVDTT